MITMEQIIELKKQGLTLSQISKQEDVSLYVLNKIIGKERGTLKYREYRQAVSNTKQKTSKRKEKTYDITMEQIIELKKQGLTLKQIAVQENVNISEINTVIKNSRSTLQYEEYRQLKSTKKPKIRDITIEEIIEFKKQGLTLYKIAEQKDINLIMIYTVIKEAKNTPQYEEYKKLRLASKEADKGITMEQIVELKKQGLTLKQIAEQENTKITTLSAEIKRAQGTQQYEEYKKTQRARTSITIEQIIELKKQGLTLKQIAEQESVGILTLNRIISKAKETPQYEEYRHAISKRRKYTNKIKGIRKDIPIEEIIELVKQGLTLKQIAEQMNIGISKLNNTIRDAKQTPQYEQYRQAKLERKEKTQDKINDIPIEQITQLVKQGLTLKQISQQQNINLTALSTAISKAKGTPGYAEYRAVQSKRMKKKSLTKLSKKNVTNKQLILFMLENGATLEEMTLICEKKEILLDVETQLTNYIGDLKELSQKGDRLPQIMISYVSRLLNIKQSDISEVEKILMNQSTKHTVSTETQINDILDQYNKKSNTQFSILEAEFVVNRITQFNQKHPEKPIEISQFIKMPTNTLAERIERIYDSIDSKAMKEQTTEERE